MRLAPRAPQLQPCSPLLPFSRSLSSTGDQLPLPAAPHLCSCPIPTIRRNPLVPLLVFAHLQPSDLRATIRPAAAVAPRNHLGRAQEQAGRRGRELNGWMVQQCGRDAPARQKPTRQQQGGGSLSHGAARRHTSRRTVESSTKTRAETKKSGRKERDIILSSAHKIICVSFLAIVNMAGFCGSLYKQVAITEAFSTCLDV